MNLIATRAFNVGGVPIFKQNQRITGEAAGEALLEAFRSIRALRVDGNLVVPLRWITLAMRRAILNANERYTRENAMGRLVKGAIAEGIFRQLPDTAEEAEAKAAAEQARADAEAEEAQRLAAEEQARIDAEAEAERQRIAAEAAEAQRLQLEREEAERAEAERLEAERLEAEQAAAQAQAQNAAAPPEETKTDNPPAQDGASETAAPGQDGKGAPENKTAKPPAKK